MITFRIFFITALIFCTLTKVAIAQSNQDSFKKTYTDHFKLTPELVFIHLNKTSVAPGENLWLSAYVYDPRLQLPNQKTANLDVSIYDEEGTYLDTKTVYISQGKGSAFIHLDPKKFISGNYFLRASTSYMLNFQEDLSYTQSFEVLGKPGKIRDKKDYDLQLLPEGGHLLAGVVNSVGVKLIDESGTGVRFSEAMLLGSDGTTVTTLESNKHGISRFFFTPELEKEYGLILKTPDGTEIRKKLEGIEKKGISLISSARNDGYLLSVRTNRETREQLQKEDFFVAIHKDGNIRSLKFDFPDDKLEANIIISKDSLFPGVNTITVFDAELRPRLERMIFNAADLKRSGITARVKENRGDSLLIRLASKPPIQRASLSVSILPSGTMANNPDHTIVSAFLLKPYVRGKIDDAHYYFSPGRAARKMHDLDLLLLTQGWSKYNWEDSHNNAPVELVRHEVGFDITGKVGRRNKRKEKTLLVRSDQEGFFEIVKINDDNTFQIEDVYLEDSTALSFGLVNEKNNTISKPSINMNMHPLKKRENLDKVPDFIRVNKADSKLTILPEGFIDEAVLLDTVMIESKVKAEEISRGEIPLIEQETVITDEIAKRFHYLKDYIATQGFRVTETQTGGVDITSRFRSSILIDELRPMIYFNGARIGRDLRMLSTLTSSDVESIIISRRGNGEGMDGVNGIIKINMKQEGTVVKKKENTVARIIAGNGFTANKEFYAPKYTSYSHSAFKNYGVIGWVPNVLPDSRGNAEFKILNVLHPEVTLFIEGMNADGVLVSEILTVKTK